MKRLGRNKIDNADEIMAYLRECKELEFLGSTKLELIESRREYMKKCLKSFSLAELLGITEGYYNSVVDTIFIFKFSQDSKQSFIFTLLHEISHVYQEKVEKMSYSEYKKNSRKFEVESNMFAYKFMVDHNEELTAKLGMYYDKYRLLKLVGNIH